MPVAAVAAVAAVARWCSCSQVGAGGQARVSITKFLQLNFVSTFIFCLLFAAVTLVVVAVYNCCLGSAAFNGRISKISHNFQKKVDLFLATV